MAAGTCGNAVLFQPAGHGIGIVAVQVQTHRGVGIGGAVQHWPHQPWLEVLEEFQRRQGRFAPALQFGLPVIPQEQALMLAQGVLDFAIARQGCIIKDAKSLRRLAFGQVEITDAAFRHQPGRFGGQLVSALTHAGLGVDMRVRFGVWMAGRHR
jgi:hypothetical protein